MKTGAMVAATEGDRHGNSFSNSGSKNISKSSNSGDDSLVAMAGTVAIAVMTERE